MYLLSSSFCACARFRILNYSDSNLNRPRYLVGLPQVPYWQSKIVQGCRKRGKPVIVATNMLESMIQNPTPTRAEVSDIAIAVREGADAIMLSGESAYGKFPFKAVSVMGTVAKRTEQAMLSYQASFKLSSCRPRLLAEHYKEPQSNYSC